MTPEEILAMQPGSELNMKVAEKVMGHIVVNDETFGNMERWDTKDGGGVWDLIDYYSEDISVAALVVDKMIEMGYEDAIYWVDFGEGKYTDAEAICKAALLAVLEWDGLKETSDRILMQALGNEERWNI